MVKTTKPQSKQNVSTRAMFRKSANDAIRSIKNGRVTKASKQEVVKQRPEHELYTTFSASIEQSREHIDESTLADYNAAYKGLSQRLAETHEYYVKKEKDITNAITKMTAPFKDEKLDWTSADGKHTGTVTLGNRMRKLQKTVDAEEIELNRQWEEWVESEAELDRLTAEFAAMPTDADHMFSADQREMEEEIKAEIAHVKKLMDEAARSSLNSAKECEKGLSLKQKNIQANLMAVLQEEYYG